jgi:hypothetical protein
LHAPDRPDVMVPHPPFPAISDAMVHRAFSVLKCYSNGQ